MNNSLNSRCCHAAFVGHVGSRTGEPTAFIRSAREVITRPGPTTEHQVNQALVQSRTRTNTKVPENYCSDDYAHRKVAASSSIRLFLTLYEVRGA